MGAALAEIRSAPFPARGGWNRGRGPPPGRPGPVRGDGPRGVSVDREALDEAVGVLVLALEGVLADDLAVGGVAGDAEGAVVEGATGKGQDLDARGVEEEDLVGGHPA